MTDTAPTRDLPVPSRALAVGAHPDDIEFGCGATLAKWADAGCAVFYLICTDGSKGTWDPSTDPAELVEQRRREQREAAERLGGCGGVRFLPWPDGELESGMRQRAQVASAIREFRPEVLLGHDPWKRYRLHPDHRHAGFLTTDGVVAARDPLFFPEIARPPHRPDALLLFESDQPDHFEVVTEEHLQRKLDALLAHESQLESTMHTALTDAARLSTFRARERQRLEQWGARIEIPLAEAFKAIEDL